MYLVYLGFIYMVGIIYVMYLINKSDEFIKKKYILIVLSVILIANSTLLIGYINQKNQLTESTYKIYLSFYDSMSRTTYSNNVETEEDVEKLLEVSKDIHKNLNILEYNLRTSEIKLEYENGEKFYQIIKNLNDYLSEFLYDHNYYIPEEYSLTEIFSEGAKKEYSKEEYTILKTELNILYDYFRLLDFQNRDKAGIIRGYSIVSKEENFEWDKKVNKRLENIRKIIVE